MRGIKKAFTLVELLVGITISMLLMTSVGVFISSGMSNINVQQKVLSDNKSFVSNLGKLQGTINSSNKIISSYSSGVLLKVQQNFDEGGYSYIGSKEITEQYCRGGETLDTQHIFTSNFIPFEEIGENINTDFEEILESEVVRVGGIDYKTSVKNHQVIDTTNNTETIGRDIFGYKLGDGNEGTQASDVFLNSPTGMIEIGGKLVFSDTLNNRILYLSGGLVYTLLDDKSGLEEPTGLAYDSGNLYISNSGKSEILKFSSSNYGNNPDLNISFEPGANFSADRFSLSFLTGSISLTGPSNIADISVTNSNINDEMLISGNNLEYYFVNNFGSNGIQSTCGANELRENGTNLIQCVSSGTGAIANLDTNTFTIGNNYSIDVSGITPSFVNNAHYYISLNFKQGTTSRYSGYYPYFTQGDNNIFTKGDNTLEIFASNLLYPTGLRITGSKITVNTFEDRKTHVFDVDGTKDSEITKTPSFSYSIFSSSYKESSIFNNPIRNITINNVGGLFNMKLDYYKMLNCFNIDEKIEKTLLFKKSF